MAVTTVRSDDPVQDEEDLLATASATYALLLAAHARGLAGYWRTPGVLRSDAGLEALGIGATSDSWGWCTSAGRASTRRRPSARRSPRSWTYLG